MKKAIIICVCLFVFIISSFAGCVAFFEYDIGLTTRHVSPHGKEIVIRYDWVSRPTIFYKNKKLWRFEGPAYTETVYFEVKWITENEILLTAEGYNIEEIIFIP